MSYSSELIKNINKVSNKNISENYSIFNYGDKEVSTSEVFSAFQEALEDKFGSINDNGCSTPTGEWLSTESVLQLLSDTLVDL